MSNHRHLRTARLRLDAVTVGDVEDLFALHSDPEVWRHYPSGRHAHRGDTSELVARIVTDWATDGLGYWTVRLADDPPTTTNIGRVIGVGGCRRPAQHIMEPVLPADPTVWGRGLGAELARAACRVATDVRPDLPIVAKLLESNQPSRATAEQAGRARCGQRLQPNRTAPIRQRALGLQQSAWPQRR